MATAKLLFDDKLKKWQAWLDDKVIARSSSKEYVISAVLDGTSKKIKKHDVDKLVDSEGADISYIQMIRASSFVKNTDRYANLVASSVEHRTIINGPLAQDMKHLRDMFSHLFYVEKSEFTFLKDMMYYTGGWPSPDSPPRLEYLFRQISTVMKFYTYFGREKELTKYFKRFGLTITLDPEKVKALSAKVDGSIHEDWYKCFGKTPMPKTKREIGEVIMGKAMDVQKEICQRADAIKITAASQAEFHCDVKPENFIAAINTAARVKKTGMRSSSALYKAKMQHVVTEAALNEALDQST